jgi:hypothetical protein
MESRWSLGRGIRGRGWSTFRGSGTAGGLRSPSPVRTREIGAPFGYSYAGDQIHFRSVRLRGHVRRQISPFSLLMVRQASGEISLNGGNASQVRPIKQSESCRCDIEYAFGENSVAAGYGPTSWGVRSRIPTIHRSAVLGVSLDARRDIPRHHGVVEPVVGQAFVALNARIPERGIFVPTKGENCLIHLLGVEHLETD